ncbi:AI-2E family transporter [Desulforamulus putei]|uniref:Predicted PurR-regulated permease PerM n=1 Tax=Desulforamulus putei DSM 12395 TaxID=1121429 RepID=A0A1M4UMN4_9FIRM|nr:AI-2E family transporter [Desulforamulus putei]SHE58052.1 Predicted PurR-regulated permease PerM [Desulforamulus putei DSM 12395]
MSWWKEKRTYRYLFLAILIGLILYFLYLVRQLFLPFILAIILVYLLNPVVGRMEKRGSPRVAAILILYLGVIIVVTGLFMYGVPRMVNQLETLVESIPVYTDQVEGMVQNIQQSFDNSTIPPGVHQIVDERIRWAELRLMGMVRQVMDLLLALLGNLFNFALAPVLAFYMMKDLEHLKKWAISQVPGEWTTDVLYLAKQIDHVFASFIRGHLTVVLIVGVLTSIAFMLIGLQFATMLGIIAGLAELIPYFGPLIGAIPAVAMALLQSKWLAVKVVIAVFVIQQLEGNIISPKILGHSVGLHPLAIIIALLAGGHLFGIAGMLLAVPLAAIARILVSFAWEKLN